MNTVKSFWVGWGSLIVAGGAAYYFAKKEINANRREKYNKIQEQQRLNSELYGTPYHASTGEDTHNNIAGHPSAEASSDPAPTRHPVMTGDEKVNEKSKYEASEAYRRPKGDRFS